MLVLRFPLVSENYESVASFNFLKIDLTYFIITPNKNYVEVFHVVGIYWF